jgi:hypothetical protein
MGKPVSRNLSASRFTACLCISLTICFTICLCISPDLRTEALQKCAPRDPQRVPKPTDVDGYQGKQKSVSCLNANQSIKSQIRPVFFWGIADVAETREDHSYFSFLSVDRGIAYRFEARIRVESAGFWIGAADQRFFQGRRGWDFDLPATSR